MNDLNNRQKKTLEGIFTDPPSPNIRFEEIESLFLALGAQKSNQGKTSGSRIRFIYQDDIFPLHKPHPERVMDKGAIKSIRIFLKNHGVYNE